MPLDTSFLNLKTYNITTDGSSLFITFLQNIGGAGLYNMGKIDSFASESSASIASNINNTIFSIYGIYNTSGSYNAVSSEITSYSSSMIIDLRLDITNSGSTTLNINSLGVRPLYKLNSSGNLLNFSSGDLLTNKNYFFIYNANTSGWYLLGSSVFEDVCVSGVSEGIIVSSGSSLKNSNIRLSSMPLITGSFVMPTLDSTFSNEKVLSSGSSTSVRINASTSSIVIDVSTSSPVFTAPSAIYIAYDDTLTIVSGSLSMASGIVSSGSFISVNVDEYGRVTSGCSNLNNSVSYLKIKTSSSGADSPPENKVVLYGKLEGLYLKESSGNETGHIISEGSIPTCNNSSITNDLIEWNKISQKLISSRLAGKTFDTTIISTYSLLFSSPDGNNSAYYGGVLSPNGDIHFIPAGASVGQKISKNGIVSTYSLIFTYSSNTQLGGVLNQNGDIYFVPQDSPYPGIGQKININGVMSTYSIAVGDFVAYAGGVLAPDGYIHFIPSTAPFGQKVSPQGVASTYSLVNTEGGYYGGVLSPNGDIHFIPAGTSIGQKISATGVVSTYSLAYIPEFPISNGGVLDQNGNIYFVPAHSLIGNKILINGTVTTYSVAYSINDGYHGGVLAPNGDIHFIPARAEVGQKINVNGTISTYALVYTGNDGYVGGVLGLNGDIYFIPACASVGTIIHTMSAKPFSPDVCLSPFLNKF